MNCETVQDHLPELLAGALDHDREMEILCHLAQCECCRGELAFWAQVSQAAKEEAATLPAALQDEVREALFGPRVLTVGESARLVGRALGLAGSACRLALAMAGTTK